MTKPEPGLQAFHDGHPVECLYRIRETDDGEIWMVRPTFRRPPRQPRGALPARRSPDAASHQKPIDPHFFRAVPTIRVLQRHVPIATAPRAPGPSYRDSEARSAPTRPQGKPATAASPGVCWQAPQFQWFCIRTRSRFEFAVRDALRAAGIPEFLPTSSVETRWTDRTNVTTRPLFAGYIFARFDPSTAQTAILQTRGVVQILSLDQRPAPIADEVIESLQRVAASPAALSPCPYVAGESVTVARGPFAGVTGVISRTYGAATLTIPIEILGRAVSVAIDASDVEHSVEPCPNSPSATS